MTTKADHAEKPDRAYQIGRYARAYRDLPHYGRPGIPLLRAMTRLLAQAKTRTGPGASFLDVSTGRGYALAIASELGFRVHGTDVCSELISDAHWPMTYAEAHELPFDDGAFNVVMNTGTLEHLVPTDSLIAITELIRVSSHLVMITLNNKPSEWHINCRPYDEWDALIRCAATAEAREWQVENLGDMNIPENQNRAWRLTQTRPVTRASER